MYKSSELGDVFQLLDNSSYFGSDIVSVFIGGAAVQGGVGTVIGSIVGGMIQGILGNGMNLNSLGISYQMTIKGLVLLLAVAFDVWSKKRTK